MDDLTKIRTLIRWSQSEDAPEDFDDSFITKMEEWYNDKGELTLKQSIALGNIIDKFKVDTSVYR